MRHRILIITACFTLLFSINKISANELKREDGLSIHLMPKRVAELDLTRKIQWGFMVSQSHALKPPLERPVFRTPEKLIEYFKTLPQKIRANGIWMIVTHPNAYSEEEKKSIEKFKKICIKENIHLFICRGSELPNGWEQVN